MSSNGFTRVSNMILNDSELNIYEKYFIIALKSFDYKNIGEVYPTYESLMALFGTKNRNTIASLIKSLKEKNYIITMKKNRANCYKFIKDYLSGEVKNNDIITNNLSSTSEINSNECDTTEVKLNTSSNSSDTSNSNVSDTSNSNRSDTTEVKLNTSSNLSDTRSSNSSDTSSSITTDTLIKQYKNKKEIYIRIFDKWNEKNISNELTLTKNIASCIESVLRVFTIEQILQAIDNYAEVYHSKFYYDYLWDLKSFLIKPNGIYKFIPEGHIWKSYLNMQKEKVKVKASEYID
ncbi:hypothetical protein LQE93_11060 [Clostridium sp. NSJ-145]|uniref:helix-turn-helix domain-containing protein n=1 Tax=Clostridium sp. NSJ-145 TaxID=2897777 RepID=UPI001E5013A0|nr:helix-turn-helix domain-containing protein [Clostridium sp. NSJ-145]MCD2502319.1 hypothetical protein [Clostridium sp. NSJ-145]